MSGGAPQGLFPPPPLQAIGGGQRTDICALLSTIFGAIGLLVSLYGGWILAIAGLILGIVSHFRLREDPALRGVGLKNCGLALSLLAILFPILAFIGLTQLGRSANARMDRMDAIQRRQGATSTLP
jgi:hypothetical protein